MDTSDENETDRTGTSPKEAAGSTQQADSPQASDDAWLKPVRTSGVDTPGDATGDPGDALLRVDIEGFEGPLDVLLALARTQKLDLTQISVLELVEQYLGFINEARRLRLEVAADYLVMAAWLTFLKSRLLLPREDDEGDETLSAEDMARRLAFRLLRLDAMRKRAEELMARPQLGADVFSRGRPELPVIRSQSVYEASLEDLVRAYARQRSRTAVTIHKVAARKVWSIKEARQRLERLIGSAVAAGDWVELNACLESYLQTDAERRTARASSFGATLEMARDGKLEIAQSEAFGPLYLRASSREPDAGDVPGGEPGDEAAPSKERR